MTFSRYSRSLVVLAAVSLLAGCLATTSSQSGGASAAKSGADKTVDKENTRPVEKVRSTHEIALDEGIALYNKGDFNGAIKRLGTITDADKPLQLQAYKYMAFSYCVSARQALCKQQFEKALKLDPAFSLAPGEHGHPLWGPVFERAAKKSK